MVTWSWTPRRISPSGLGSAFSTLTAAMSVVSLDVAEPVYDVPPGTGWPVVALKSGTYRGSLLM